MCNEFDFSEMVEIEGDLNFNLKDVTDELDETPDDYADDFFEANEQMEQEFLNAYPSEEFERFREPGGDGEYHDDSGFDLREFLIN